MTPSSTTRRLLAVCVFALVGLSVARLSAHDFGADVTIQALVKPEGNTMRLLTRVPIVAMKVDWPLRAKNKLAVEQADEVLAQAAMKYIGTQVAMKEGETTLPAMKLVAVRARPNSDRAFESFDTALASVLKPETGERTVDVDDSVMYALFETPITSAASRFSLDPRWGPQLGKAPLTIIRLSLPDGGVRAYELEGEEPGMFELDPAWYTAVAQFIVFGFQHILSGTDHMLFLFALVVPFRKLRQLLVLVTAFTVAHSITLIASAYDLAPGFVWFPPLIEALIAASIVYMTFENIIGANLHRRWMVTFGFGLIHGFGFSFALKHSLQFAGPYLLSSLLSFNIGVEFGQLLVLLLVVPALNLTFKFMDERIGAIFLSALVAHTGWHWMVERVGILRLYPFEMPSIGSMVLVGVVVLLAGAGTWWAATRATAGRDDRLTRARV
ncbi:MAG: HupE/UreJ family protein [Vicinamibacterales bacterium]